MQESKDPDDIELLGRIKSDFIQFHSDMKVHFDNPDYLPIRTRLLALKYGIIGCLRHMFNLFRNANDQQSRPFDRVSEEATLVSYAGYISHLIVTLFRSLNDWEVINLVGPMRSFVEGCHCAYLNGDTSQSDRIQLLVNLIARLMLQTSVAPHFANRYHLRWAVSDDKCPP